MDQDGNKDKVTDIMHFIINIMDGDERDNDMKEMKDGEGEEKDVDNVKLKLLPNLQRFFCNGVKTENLFDDELKSSCMQINYGNLLEYTNFVSGLKCCLDYFLYANVGEDEQGLKWIGSKLM